MNNLLLNTIKKNGYLLEKEVFDLLFRVDPVRAIKILFSKNKTKILNEDINLNDILFLLYGREVKWNLNATYAKNQMR